MGIGREVADAFIDVHGDITKFRESLAKAAVAGRKAGADAADSFEKGFKKRGFREVTDQWESTLDALYNNKSVDWERLFGKFNSKNLDEAARKVKDLAGEMQRAGKIDWSDWAELSESVDAAVMGIREGEDATKKFNREQERLGFQTALNQREQERYNKSFEGLTRNSRLKEMESDFVSIAKAMDAADWTKFTKGFSDLDKAQTRITAVVNEMQSLGNITDSNAARTKKSIADFVRGETQRAEALRNTKREMAEASEKAKTLQKSFNGIVEATKLKNLETDFRRIAEAMATTNWGPLSKDFGSMVEFRKRVNEVNTEMSKVGLISESEFGRVRNTINEITVNQKKFNVELDSTSRKFRPIQMLTGQLSKSWSRMDSTVRVVLTSIAAAAGPIATLGSGLAGAITAIASSAAMAAGSIVPIAAGVVGLGIGTVLAVQQFDRLRQSIPLIQSSLDGISSSWQTQANAFGDAWGAALSRLLSTFDAEFAKYDFGAPLGEAFANISNAAEQALRGPGFAALMEAMTTTLPQAASGLGVGFVGLFNGLTSLMAGAAPVAAMLGEDFARWGSNIAESLEKARASGELAATFEKMRESLLAVLDFTGSLGSLLGTIFGAGADSGNRMLGVLTGLVDQFNAFLKTTDGQTALTEWFTNAERIMGALGPVLATVGAGIAGLVDAQSISQFENLMTGISELSGTIIGLLDVISELGVLNILVGALNAIGAAVTPLLPGLHELAQALGPTLSGAISALTPLFSAIGNAVAPIISVIADLVAQIGPPLVDAFQRISTALSPLIEGFGEFAGTILGFVGPIIGDFLIGIINNVVGVIEGFAKVITGMVDTVVAIFNGDWKGAWEGIKTIVSGAVQAVWNLVQLWIIGRLGAVLKGFLGPLTGLFSKAWSGIGKGISAAAAPIINFFKTTLPGVVNAAKAIFTNFPAVVSAAFNLLKGIVVTAATTVGLAIITGIGAAVTWVQENIGNIGQFFSDTWNNIVTGVTEFGTMFMEGLTAIFGGIGEWFAGIFGGAKEAITTPMSDASTGIQEIWMGVTEFFTGLIENIKLLFAGVGEFFTTLWASITEVFATAWTNISLAVTVGIEGIRTMFGGFFEGIAIAVQAGWDVITTIFTAVWETLKLIVATAILIVVGLFTNNFTLIQEAVSAFWTKVTEVWTTATEGIKTILTGAWEAIKTTTTTSFNAIKAFITDTLNNIKSFMSDSWNNIKQVTTDTWNNIKQFISNAWNNIKQFISSGIEAAKNSVTTGWNNVKSATTNAWNSIKSFISDSWNNIRNAVTNGINNAKSAIQNGWNSAKQFTVDAWNNIKNGVRDGMNNAKEAVQTGISNIVSFFSGLPGKMASAVSGAAGRMRSIGQDIINGLTGGIKAMAQNAINAVGDVVNGAINWAKGLLGINSPSRVFRQFGVYTGEGLAIGMKSMKSAVQKASGVMAAATTDAFSTSKFFVAGKDAAAGLAKGLASESSTINGALSGLSYSVGPLSGDRIKTLGTTPGVPGVVGQGGGINIAPGAIVLQSNASDSEVLAEKIMDNFAAHTRG